MTSSRVDRLIIVAGTLALWGCGGPARGMPGGDPPAIPPPAPEVKVAGYKGYDSINQALRARFVGGPEEFQLTTYLGRSGPDLTMLLGAWQGAGVSNEFANATPNATSFLIWRTAFIGLGRDVARLCPGTTEAPQVARLALHPPAAAAAAVLCRWPEGIREDPEAWLTLWLALVGYDAPFEEYQTWRAHFESPTYRTLPAQEVIPLMVAGALLNPFVLLAN
jgi:hypothetical protein